MLDPKDLFAVNVLKELAKQYHSEPYWFGLGFIQLKLSDSERMHFWHRDIPHVEREEIHNHRYDFESQVLVGELVHDTYSVTNLGFCPDAKYEIFQTACKPGQEGTVEQVLPCKVESAGKYYLKAGTKYTFPHNMFHTTEGTKLAVTFLTRQPKVLEFASVVKLVGAPTICPFREKISPEICWDYIEEALR